MKVRSAAIVAAVVAALTACGSGTYAVSYGGENHTDEAIVSVVVNGEGGVLDITAHTDGGASMCCINLPKTWRPGLKATVKWRNDSTPMRDANGKDVYRNGVPALIEAPWKERTVEIPKYEEKGFFFIHFLPDDEVKVAVTSYLPGHPKHPYRFVDTPVRPQ